MVGRIFLSVCQRQMSGEESSGVQLHQADKTEQAPGQSPEEHRKKQEQDQTLGC